MTNETATIIIDRDTCTMILDASEMTRENVEACISEIAVRIEDILDEEQIDATVECDYRTTGRRSEGMTDRLNAILERVIVGECDEIRAAVYALND